MVTSIAAFMVTLDNLVVTTAIPVIREDLGASLEDLEWTVNAYTLSFAVLLLTGAALGDRFGRRRLFGIGLAIFTAASAAAALAPNVEALVAARAVQGLGGAIVAPVTLTILASAVPAEKRGLALGAWGGIGGLAVALGPLVGGAIVEAATWQWIFWLNVPIGLALIPLASRTLAESRGPNTGLDLVGLGLVSAGLLGLVWGIVRGNASSRASACPSSSPRWRTWCSRRCGRWSRARHPELTTPSESSAACSGSRCSPLFSPPRVTIRRPRPSSMASAPPRGPAPPSSASGLWRPSRSPRSGAASGAPALGAPQTTAA